MSYFGHASAARRYASARPYFHPVVRDLIRRRLALGEPVARALDVACGTGQSTRILCEVARQVVGVDRSAEMLALAPRMSHVHWVRSRAESLPFADASFGLVTVALALHWFERGAFLAESARVLQHPGWLVIYNNAFRGTMRENATFAGWFRECYLSRFPTPDRNRTPLSTGEAREAGLELIGQESYANEIDFDRDTLVAYLMTQSNVISVVEEGSDSINGVHAWLTRELTPLFLHDTVAFEFGGPITFLRTLPG